MPDHKGGGLAVAVKDLGREQIACHLHFVPVLEGDVLQGSPCRCCRSCLRRLTCPEPVRRNVCEGHAERGDAQACKFERAAAAGTDAVLFNKGGWCCLHDLSPC